MLYGQSPDASLFLFRTLLMIMKEMIQTERDYVKALAYIIEVRLLKHPVVSISTCRKFSLYDVIDHSVELHPRTPQRRYTTSIARPEKCHLWEH